MRWDWKGYCLIEYPGHSGSVMGLGMRSDNCFIGNYANRMCVTFAWICLFPNKTLLPKNVKKKLFFFKLHCILSQDFSFPRESINAL